MKIYTVKTLTDEIKYSIETQFENIWIIGEISNLKEHKPSGHCYFSLKDEDAIIKAILFKSQKNKINFHLKDGIQIKAHGQISLYKKKGEYQIIIDHMKPQGLGTLELAFLELKEKLLNEGLFNPETKQTIPKYPKYIAVITSPTSAAIKDILNISKRRFPASSILIYPTLVQGKNANTDIANKIKLANKTNIADIIILGRGGGSIEDLHAFNTEEVARAIFNSKIPTISAVGHEIDYSIADFVADIRAPTPSAAAEIALPNKNNLNSNLNNIETNIHKSISKLIETYKEKINSLSQENLTKIINKQLNDRQIQLEHSSQNLNQTFNKLLTMFSNKFKLLYTNINALNPKAILKRGYSLVYLENNSQKLINNSQKLKENDHIEIQFHKGKTKAIVKKN